MTNFSKLIKELLKPLPKNDYPALDTFTFLSCWIGFAVRIQVLELGIREGIDRSELVVDIKAC
jgi:hypothetical protein